MTAPYRAPHAPEAPPAKEPDVDPEITTREGHRTRALLVSPEDLATGGEADLEHRELIRCDACEGAGCSVCNERGATIRKSTVRVPWRAGATEGDVVTLEGRGDVPGLHAAVTVRSFPGGRGDLLVRIGTKKAPFRTIENAERRRQRRQRQYLELRATAHSRARTQRRRGLIAGAVMLLGVGGLSAFAYLRKGTLGADCSHPNDCRSGLCVESTGVILGKGGFTEKRCSQKCQSDVDCPGGLSCVDLSVEDRLTSEPGKTVRACGHE